MPERNTNIPMEIERKFLIGRLPEIVENLPCKEIVQGYLAIAEDGTEVRLRKKGDMYYQTIKKGEGKTRSEIEIEITQIQFEAMWPLAVDKSVEKTRYETPFNGFVIEIDVYHGQLQGLFTAEIEFNSEEASINFVPPDWLGKDVTTDKRYKNKSLAVNGIPQ